MNPNLENRTPFDPDSTSNKDDIRVNREPLEINKTPNFSTYRELSENYVLFTHAPILLYSQLGFDPLAQFFFEKNLSAKPIALFNEKPIFSNLGYGEDQNWNHILFGVEKDIWPKLAEFLGTIAISDVNRKLYTNVICQKLPMVDYMAISKLNYLPKVLPNIEIYSTALDTNKYCLHFQPAKNPPKDTINFVKSNPRKETVDLANSIFNGKPDYSLLGK